MLSPCIWLQTTCGHVGKCNQQGAQRLISGKGFPSPPPSSVLAEPLINSDMISFLSLPLWKRKRDVRKQHRSGSSKDQEQKAEVDIFERVIKSLVPVLWGAESSHSPPTPNLKNTNTLNMAGRRWAHQKRPGCALSSQRGCWLAVWPWASRLAAVSLQLLTCQAEWVGYEY